MLKEIRFKEVYTYTVTLDIKEGENIEDVIHLEVPLLIDRSESSLNDIKENGNFDLHVETEYDL